MIADVLTEAKGRMERAVEAAKDDFATVRTGRANPQLFQKLTVDVTTGSPTPLQQLASMQNPEVRPHHHPVRQDGAEGDRGRDQGHAEPRCADLTNDGHLVRITMPELTEEAPQGVRQARACQG